VFLNRKFGRYVLLKRIAVGGMAEIFLALKLGPGPFEKFVVVKCILAHCNDSADFVRLFYREAELSGRLSHPNLVQTFDCDIQDGVHYMVMEYMQGVTVAEMAERGAELALPLPQDYAIKICIDACEALYYLHGLRNSEGEELGVVHLDVSPQNLFVGFDGVCKLFDFGIARLSQDRDDDPHKGMLAGKYAYMSPEQCRGEEVDWRSDVFSLGIILYELTTGQRLFKRENQIQTLRAITEEPLVAPSEVLERYPRFLERVVLKALARDRTQRYESALALCEDLRKFLKISGSKPTTHLVGAYVAKLFTEEVRAQRQFCRAAVSAVERRFGRMDPLAGLASAEDGFEEPLVSDVMPVISDADDGVDGAWESSPAEVASFEEVREEVAPYPSPPEERSGPKRLAMVELAHEEASSAVDVAQYYRAKRINHVLAAVAILAVGLGVASIVFLLMSSDLRRPREGKVAETQVAEVVQGDVGVLRLSSTPSGAEIWVNDAWTGRRTPAEIVVPWQEPQTVALKVRGFEPFLRDVVLADGQAVLSLHGQLRRSEEIVGLPTAEVRVLTRPPGARLHVDGLAVAGGTPLVLPGLSVGVAHVLVLELGEHVSLVFPLTLEDSSTLELELALEPLHGASAGTLVVDSWPRGAQAFVDGVWVGQTPLPPLRLRSETSYAVRVVGADGVAREETLWLQGEGVQQWSPELVGGEVREDGEVAVEVLSAPSASVWVGGRHLGRSPLVGVPLGPGVRWLEFRDAAEGIDYAYAVEVAGLGGDHWLVEIPRGRIVVDVWPEAEVGLNGSWLGPGAQSVEVYAGEHQVMVREGARVHQVVANVSAGMEWRLRADFPGADFGL